MRRPALTKAQRQHNREQRAMLALRRAAVFYAAAVDISERGSLGDDGPVAAVLAGANVEAAALRYVETLSMRDRSKLLGMRWPR